MVSAQTAEVTLKGKVIDAADGYPIIGASVVLDGTKLGAITDADGNFELKIPKKKCDIVISCIGYEDEVMVYTLNNASSFGRIVMSANAEQLADVVVTGVYERKKESFTGSSATGSCSS